MSAPSKSNDKNKRYPGIKPNDFVNKTKTNETSRATARTQGWTNLGKISSRRVPPPANVPSLKSETGTIPPTFDPILPTGTIHGWTASGNQTPTTNQQRPLTPSKQPTQQQLDSLPAHSSTPPPSSSSTDIDKPRLQTTWSTVTAGATSNSNDQPPNLLGLNDFPRLVTQDNNNTTTTNNNNSNNNNNIKNSKSPSDSVIGSLSTNTQGPIFRPANLASWKEGGGRAQPISNDSNDNNNNNNNNLSIQPQVLTTNTNSQIQNPNNSSYMRMYQQQQQPSAQMWSYNLGNSYSSYGPNPTPSSMSMHPQQQQQRVSSYNSNNQSQRHNQTTDYKTPTILRNKDIDDLSKLTDNVTWANASQEVNYQEKIQFSDDEDNDLKDNKSRRFNNKTNSQHQHQHQHQQTRQTYPQVLQNTNRTRSRLLQDDEHVKQMQDDKNSELINTLTVAKQRRDEQERHLRDQKQIPGYQTRPLLPSTGQENLSSTQTDSSSSWGQTNPAPSASTTTTTSRTRHDTTDSQSFTMKSWSDQMETFNYASLHEKSGGQGDIDDHNDDTTNTSTQRTRKYSGSPSESSSQSQTDTLTKNRSKHLSIKQRLPNTNMKSKTTDVIDYFDNNNNNDQQMRSNDQWGDWDDTNYSTNNRYQQQYTNDRRRHTKQQQQQQQSSDNQRSYRSNEQINDYNRTKQPTKTRTNVTSRSSDIQPSSSTTKSDNSKPVPNKIQQAPWRALSPTRPPDSNDPTPQEAISYKSQIKTNNDISDRRQSAPTERKQRYTTTTPINTSSIPPLMSVRSDVPPTISTTSTAATTKNLKTSNQSQRQDYSNSSHYSQRNDFYNDTNDSAWGNDDEYYDDDTGYYDPNIPTHQRHHHSMAYQSHLHHRGYIALGSYGRYRRGGTLRHQQQYNTYNINNQSGASSSQLNTSTGSKAKKILTNRTVSSSSTSTTNKKPNQTTPTEQTKPIEEPVKNVSDEPVKKPSVWSTEPKSTVVEEIPIIKSVETPTVPTVIEKPKETIIPEQKTENESNIVPQIETESATTATTNKKSTANNSQRKTNYNQDQHYQDQHYQNQQTTRHRNTYTRSMQDYESMQMAAHTYFGTNRRTTRGGRTTRMHDLSSGYYYEHPQQRYNNRYSYSTDPYQQSHSTRSTFKTKKRGASTTAATITDHQQNKQQTASGNNTNNNNLQHQSVSDNEQKEGEEWETASESSANMRHNPPQINKITTHETNTTKRERTPPKKSFSSQRPSNIRSNDITVRRSHNLYERGSKSTRGVRTSRLTTTQKQTSPQKSELELAKQMKKDPHRHSLDGYDLNNVAGVVKIETLPAGALEEESTAFDDGGEEFCVVMSKRGRKEQKAAQLSKQIAVEVPVEQPVKSTSIDNDEQQTNEKTSNETNSTRPRNGKSLPPRFNSKTSSSTTRQSKGDHQNYYDQGYYYYYDQNTYYDHDGSYYNYNNYNQSHRQTSTRRKQQQQPPQPQPTTRNQQSQQQQPETNVTTDEKKVDTEKNPSNVMSNIQMWNPHTDNTISNSSKLIEKPTHDRKFANDIVSTNDASLPLHQRTATELPTHSPVSKTNETIARTIKPPMTDNKSDRDAKTKSASYEKNDTMSSLGSNQLFEKSTFLDYDDKQSIGTVGDDYNQKINSLKTIWDISDHPSGQLEQTINSMVAMQQQKQQDTNVQSNNPTKSDNYVQEPISTSSTNPNVTSTANDDTNTKNSSTNPNIPTNPSVSTHNQSATYSTNTNSNKNEAKNICTVKPTQQVPPNIQDQVDVSPYQTFAAPPLLPPMSQASLQQQHILPQSQVNPVHQQHSYTFYENLMAPPQQQPPPPPPQQQQQPPFNRIYPSTTNSTNNDPINSDFSSIQYPPQNFPYRNTNVFMPPTNVPNTGSMYHHTSQGSISAPPQNNTMPPPPQMPSYPPQFLVDHGGHMISQAQAPPPPTQPYMNNQMMSGRPQGGPFYRTAPQQQLQTPPGPPPYGTQDPLAHGGYYQPFFPPPNSNAPPVGHPSAHNLYGQNENFHPPHPQMFPRGGSMDRTDHPLMSQPLSRPTNYPSQSSNQQQAPPPSLLSKNFPSFHTNQQQTSSSNQAQAYYPPPNQYNRQSVPIGAMNPTNNRQPNQPVPSLMSGLTKNFPNNGNNLNNNPSSLAYRQPLITPQTNNNNNNPNRSSYQPHPQYPTYSKSTPSNDDNVKPKHI